MEATEGTPPPRPSSDSSGSGGSSTAFDAWHRAPDGRLRREVWPSALDLRDTTSPECIRIPGHYHALLALAGETPETAQQIEKDLPRTGATFAVQGLLKPGARFTKFTFFKTRTFFLFFYPPSARGCPPTYSRMGDKKENEQRRWVDARAKRPRLAFRPL